MKISEIAALLHAETRSCRGKLDLDVSTAFGADMLSDVLALSTPPDVLLTGLMNPQVIRTAEMLDTACVVFIRNKIPADSVVELAERSGICVLTAPCTLFTACGLLYAAGLQSAG